MFYYIDFTSDSKTLFPTGNKKNHFEFFRTYLSGKRLIVSKRALRSQNAFWKWRGTLWPNNNFFEENHTAEKYLRSFSCTFRTSAVLLWCETNCAKKARWRTSSYRCRQYFPPIVRKMCRIPCLRITSNKIWKSTSRCRYQKGRWIGLTCFPLFDRKPSAQRKRNFENWLWKRFQFDEPAIHAGESFWKTLWSL